MRALVFAALAIAIVLILACVLVERFPREGCIQYRAPFGTTYEKVMVLGENKANVWEYEILFPDSNRPDSVYYINKDRVQFFGCPTPGLIPFEQPQPFGRENK